MTKPNETSTELLISHQIEQDQLIISLTGMLTRQQAQQAQQSLDALLHTHHPKKITIKADKIENCDSAGLVTISNFIDQCGQANNIHADVQQLNTKFEALWQAILNSKSNEVEPANTETLGYIEKVGKVICEHFCSLAQSIAYLGEILYYFFHWMRHIHRSPLRNFWYYVEDIGPNSFPLIALIGVLFGLILSFQSLVQLKVFGAEIYTANLVAVSLIRELGPLLMAIVLTGRIASAYAAEISAMKVNQEIDALKSMGLDPVPFLILPRLFAAALVAPFLSLLLNLFGLIGCGLLMLAEGFTRDVIIQQMFSFVSMTNLFTSMFKSVIFGLIIASIGCIQGLKSGRDATSVGLATTTTVVRSIVAIVVADGLFAVIFYALGI